MAAPLFADRKSFTVPLTSGQYAPEEILLAPAAAAVIPYGISSVTALIEASVAWATLELWLLRVGGDPTVAGDYKLSSMTASLATVGSATWNLAAWRGAKLRAKSGGTAGTATVSAKAAG